MKENNDAVVFSELLSPEDREALAGLFESDAALAEAGRQWRQVRAAVRSRYRACLPERDLFVAYVLRDAGYGDALSDAEARVLEQSAPAIARLVEAHPGLADAARRIQADAAVFEQAWDACWREAHPRHGRTDRRAVPSGRRTRARWPWRIAVGVSSLVFLAIVISVLLRDSGLQTVRTAQGEMRVVALADGSTVRLLGGSELTYAGSERSLAGERRVRLEGRAYFEVVPGEQVFTVETPTAVTTVLGTKFGVTARPEVTEVVLTTGHVALAPKSAPRRMVSLEPGQMSRVAEGALPTTPSDVDVTEALAWTGLFIFTDTPLREITSTLSDAYGVEVASTETLQGEEVTGTFERARPLQETLDALAATLGAKVEGDATHGYRLIPAI
ncbi:MAG TPA: FecR domain-containing protein [Rhodothermales bacterium]|nr:FecR domain-containing protein [Rhodothermales bacterium]